MIFSAIGAWLESETGIAIRPETARPVSGGCIHEAFLVERREGGHVFLKTNTTDHLALFETEKRSLDLLAASGAIRVPVPYAFGLVEGTSVLAMEGLELRSGGGPGSQKRLAAGLAALHDSPSPTGAFGAEFDNFIGATPQANGWMDLWADFFVVRRLEPQFALAAARGRRFPDAVIFLERVHSHLASLTIRPALLHGDLWGGNVAFLADGEPVLYDPACYYGDRETDLAFTRLFGGFGPGFYSRYRMTAPEPEGAREAIYNLYHLLNHDHLFGGGYADQAEAAMRRIRREIG